MSGILCQAYEVMVRDRVNTYIGAKIANVFAEIIRVKVAIFRHALA